VSRGADGIGVWKYFQDKNRAPGMTEEKKPTPETNKESPSASEQVVPPEVHANGVRKNCDPDCISPEDSTLIVRNDRNLFQNFSPSLQPRERSSVAFIASVSENALSRSRGLLCNFARFFL